MVFHITNYMRETNVWMIRKMRWMFWSFFLFVPAYRNFYWDYLGRRVAWKDDFKGSEEDKRAEAESLKGDWGFHPRYEAKYPFSIKTQKYAQQTREEAYRDMPRLTLNEGIEEKRGNLPYSEVRSIVMTVREHNRQPGAFDYNYPQTFYSHYADID